MTHAPIAGVARIAVLRPNAVGDFVFALPALHALKQAYPHADLALVGKPWHAAFLRDRPGPVDRVLVMPAVPGVGAPPGSAADQEELARFVDAMRAERFDLAVQMFGSGRYSNAFMRQFGARVTVGSRGPGAALLDRWLPYREPVPRRLALLEIAGLAGASCKHPPTPELQLTPADRAEGTRALPGEPYAVLQPGATDPRRRWPAQRFAQLGDALVEQGLTVAIHGAGDEASLVDAVASQMRHHAVRLASKLSLGGLCAVLERAALVVSNDTGPLHLALALGVPSVGIFWLTNLVEGMPLRPSLLHAALSVQTRCPVCGVDNRGTRCPHDVSFVDDVGVDEVARLARQALAAL